MAAARPSAYGSRAAWRRAGSRWHAPALVACVAAAGENLITGISIGQAAGVYQQPCLNGNIANQRNQSAIAYRRRPGTGRRHLWPGAFTPCLPRNKRWRQRKPRHGDAAARWRRKISSNKAQRRAWRGEKPGSGLARAYHTEMLFDAA